MTMRLFYLYTKKVLGCRFTILFVNVKITCMVKNRKLYSLSPGSPGSTYTVLLCVKMTFPGLAPDGFFTYLTGT